MMRREFTQREKVLLLLLTVLLMALGYMKLFYEPVQESVTAAQVRQAEAEDALLVEQMKLGQLRAMEAELEELKASGNVQDAELPPYDNVENVMVQLNAILSTAQEYSLDFQEVRFGEDGLVSRPIQMTFAAGNYDTARGILNDLYHCWYRCSLDGVTVSGEEDVSRDSPVTVSLTVTFYEKQT